MAAPNTSPMFSPPILKPDNCCWIFCSPSGVESWPNTCFAVSPMPEIFPVNLSNMARPPSPNTVPTMPRMSSKWSPSSETTATIVPRLVMAGPNVPSSDMKPPPSFDATGPTVEPRTFSPAPANWPTFLTAPIVPPASFVAPPTTLFLAFARMAGPCVWLKM